MSNTNNTTDTNNINGTGTCAVCDATVKVRKGVTSHHGFKRPGCGHTLGACEGAKEKPWEVSPEAADYAFHRYLEAARSCERGAKELREGNPSSVTLITPYLNCGFTVYTREKNPAIFDAKVAQAAKALDDEAAALRAIAARLEKKVEGWKPGTLKA